MKKKIYKKAGFWIRFLSRVLDVFIFGLILIGTSFAFLSHNKIEIGYNHPYTSWTFDSTWKYITWLIINIIQTFSLFILLPFFTNGRTIGMFICRIKIHYLKNKKRIQIFKSQIYREIFFGLSWSFLMFLFIILMYNPRFFIKFISTNRDSINFTTWQNVRISIITTFSGLIIFIQLISGISVGIKREKSSFIDKLSKTETVWEKYQLMEDEPKFKKIPTKIVKREKIEWME
ncbi:MAG: RDD family protein [Mollicutes bacterium PWAP]|nr:RDD family protein [Mollicutes bacterium PWAP]